jgi:hypothetical protein
MKIPIIANRIKNAISIELQIIPMSNKIGFLPFLGNTPTPIA